ncbi:SDR family NAD(P)-dependent oxidoreductase [Nocardia sp. NPDC050175]|uniref:SDR family NAD(P)-dependent oxidoreductase n=1 Tax=Nocardia sp. NPDC050175 TaxID=3364317 RepID=UPI0037B5E408
MTRVDPRGAVVVITGAGRGIGAATARRYASLGASVVAVDIDESAAKQTAAACHGSAYSCDVADAAAVADLADQVGPVDILVNNAGVGVGGPFLETTLDDWAWLRSINLDGVINCCHLFGAGMVARRHGHVVNIASGAGYLPNRRMATYCASKAAVIMLSRCLRADWAARGVGVSAICPGVINTGIHTRSRLRGSAIAEQDWIAKAFGYSHDPDVVAKSVVAAVAHNRGLVSSGFEVRLAYQVMRVLPGPIVDAVARV